MQKSREWSDTTKSQSEIEVIGQKVRLQNQEILQGRGPKAARTAYGKLSDSSWHKAGGVDNGPIGSAQYFNYISDMGLMTDKEFGGHFNYNETDTKIYFKLLVKYFGEENDGKINYY